MATTTDWGALGARLQKVLHLTETPIGITFGPPADGVAAYDEPFAPPAPDGRTGRVPAGCVFWIKAADRTFSTVAADHGNCSVGLMTHGFKTMPEVAGNSDVAALLESGWVTEAMVPAIPTVSPRQEAVTYGPLHESPDDPDVVLLRLNAKQAMVLSDAWPSLRIEGKPQCHIVAVAKEQGEVAASVGCMLSRVRTGLPSTEFTCAVPASKLSGVVDAVEATAEIDAVVAAYASEDARRFSS